MHDEDSDSREPTEKQLDYARRLRIALPESVDRGEISQLIDQAKDNAPATDKQLEFLGQLGVTPPPGVTSSQVSTLIDTALGIRNQVEEGIRKQLEEDYQRSGMLLDSATVASLLREIGNRERPFIALVLEDEEFHYQDVPVRAALRWSDDLSREDMLFLLLSLGRWALSLDLNSYSEEYDGELPNVEFNAHEVESEDVDRDIFFGDDGEP